MNEYVCTTHAAEIIGDAVLAADDEGEAEVGAENELVEDLVNLDGELPGRAEDDRADVVLLQPGLLLLQGDDEPSLETSQGEKKRPQFGISP